MHRNSITRNKKALLRQECLDLLDHALKILRRQSSYSEQSSELEPEIITTIADPLCHIACVLPILAGITDKLVRVGYSGAILGLSVSGESHRTRAKYSWYYGLCDGVVFQNLFVDYRLIPRCTDDFWKTVTDLMSCNGKLCYDINEVMTSKLTKHVPQQIFKPRSTILTYIRDILLASIDDDIRYRDLGPLSVKWPLDTDTDVILSGMEKTLINFNKLNQSLHRLAYLDKKGRQKNQAP